MHRWKYAFLFCTVLFFVCLFCLFVGRGGGGRFFVWIFLAFVLLLLLLFLSCFLLLNFWFWFDLIRLVGLVWFGLFLNTLPVKLLFLVNISPLHSSFSRLAPSSLTQGLVISNEILLIAIHRVARTWPLARERERERERERDWLSWNSCTLPLFFYALKLQGLKDTNWKRSNWSNERLWENSTGRVPKALEEARVFFHCATHVLFWWVALWEFFFKLGQAAHSIAELGEDNTSLRVFHPTIQDYQKQKKANPRRIVCYVFGVPATNQTTPKKASFLFHVPSNPAPLR